MTTLILAAYFCLGDPEGGALRQQNPENLDGDRREELVRLQREYDEKLLKKHPSELKEEWYLDFSRNGNRTRHGGPYAERIETFEKLIAAGYAGVAEKMAPKAAEYLKALLAERAWTIPAHDHDLKCFNGTELSVDLGCGRRGEAVAEALEVFGKYWDKSLVDEARAALEKRVFAPYLATVHGAKIKQHWWFHTANNWNAVCHKCVVAAALHYYPFGSTERSEIVKAAVGAMPYFIGGFTDDGYCSEGAGYWCYGFGHFLVLGEMLRAAPEKIDLFAMFPKAKLVARYGIDYHMTSGVSPRFADGGGTPSRFYVDMCRKIWPDLGDCKLGPSSVFPIAQVFISRPAPGGSLSLGCKGGHNDEFHNHNDLGSYCIAIGDTIVTGDPGGEVYTRRTFSRDRYVSKVLNSYAHPVPQMDGALQGTGRKFAAKVLKSEFTDACDTVALDLTAAYPTTNLVSYFRTFVYDRSSGAVKITDAVKFSRPSDFVDPLITHGEFKDGLVVCKGRKLSVDVSVKGGDWFWSEETVENPGCADVKVKAIEMKSVTEATVSFTLSAVRQSLASASLEEAVARGVDYLLAKQNAAGYWSDRQMPALTALPVWALAGSEKGKVKGEKVVAAVKKGVDYVLSTQRDDGGFYIPKPGRGGSGLGNYNTSVCLSALFDTGIAPTEAMLKAREYIASSQLVGDDTMAGGFGYDKVSRRRYADLSNTSYALSAMAKTASLEEHRTTGKRVDLDWDKAIAFVETLMKKEGPDAGGAAYNDRTAQAGSETNKSGKVQLKAYGSMTYAAVLSMCSAKLDRGDPRVRQSLEYMTKNWSVDENPGMGSQGLYYFYDIMARALAAAGVDDVGGHNWKKELSAKLISLQKPDGSWANDNNRFWEADPVLCTSFAMLVLEVCK